MKYNFAFYTGHGIGSISAHTIKAYYVPVNADNDLEAIKKLDKKRGPLCKYNDAFRYHKCAVQLEDKLGCCFIEDNVIKWQDEEVFAGPQVFGSDPYRRKIYPGKYIFDGQWALANCWTSIYPSYTAWFNYVWDRFSGEKYTCLIGPSTIKQDLLKYYYDSIISIMKKSKSQCEIGELQLLLDRTK